VRFDVLSDNDFDNESSDSPFLFRPSMNAAKCFYGYTVFVLSSRRLSCLYIESSSSFLLKHSSSSSMYAREGLSSSAGPGMASSALKRLLREYRDLSSNPPDGIIAGPVSEENFFVWEASLVGPEGTSYEYGVFTALLTFPYDYPLNPPKMVFREKLFHPNIYPNGEVCISILHAPGDDPAAYELSSERWSPVQSVEKILLSVVSMLAEPNIESPANVDAAKMWRDDRPRFRQVVLRQVMISLGLL